MICDLKWFCRDFIKVVILNNYTYRQYMIINNFFYGTCDHDIKWFQRNNVTKIFKTFLLLQNIRLMRNSNLRNHVSIIVVSQCPAEFLVVHGGLVFPLSPHLSHHFGVVQFELSLLPYPLNHLPTVLVSQ